MCGPTVRSNDLGDSESPMMHRISYICIYIYVCIFIYALCNIRVCNLYIDIHVYTVYIYICIYIYVLLHMYVRSLFAISVHNLCIYVKIHRSRAETGRYRAGERIQDRLACNYRYSQDGN